MSSYVWGIPRAAARTRRRRVAPVLATVAGHLVRHALRAGRFLPGFGGAGAIVVGAWLAWPPAGFVVAGLFLLALDRRMS